MTIEITIVTKDYRESLERLMKKLRYPSLNRCLGNSSSKGYSIWQIRLPDGFRSVGDLADKIADMYIFNISEALMMQLALKKHWHLDYQEYQQIIKDYNFIFLKWERKQISEQIETYFKHNDHLVIEGFLDFRLQWYIKELDKLLDELLSEYLKEKDFENFLVLLKQFVRSQPTKLKKVHLLSNNQKTELHDQNGERLSNDYLKKIAEDIEADEADIPNANNEELIISALIALSPKEIVIHVQGQISTICEGKEKSTRNQEYSRINSLNNSNMTAKDYNLFDLLETVFYGRINYCSHCDFCKI